MSQQPPNGPKDSKGLWEADRNDEQKRQNWKGISEMQGVSEEGYLSWSGPCAPRSLWEPSNVCVWDGNCLARTTAAKT